MTRHRNPRPDAETGILIPRLRLASGSWTSGVWSTWSSGSASGVGS